MTKDKRLCAILEQIPKCETVADIGCDHGLTCLLVLKTGKAERVIATDISKMSLQKAENLLCESAYSDKAQFRCGNGLSVLDQDEADVIVISGMGGAEIIDILSRKEIRATYVLSPQSEVDEVRRWLVSHGFRLAVDKTISSADKFYAIIKAEEGDDSYTEKEFLYGRDNLKEKSQDFLKWIEFELNRIQRIIKTSDSESTVRRFKEYENELVCIKINVN